MGRYDFSGRTALVTGGSGGIGQATCNLLRAGGAKVATFDLRSVDDYRVDLPLSGDATSTADLDRAIQAVRESFGSLDILVTAAGIFPPATPTLEVTDDLWRKAMEVNATGTYIAVREAGRVMVEQGYGRIVTIASIAALEGVPDGDAYAASKAAVISITRTVGRSLAGTGVLVNCVVPALIETEMADALSPDQRRHAVAAIPMGRLGRAEEVATLIAYLASEDLSFSTGAAFDVTGGRASW